MPSAYKERLVAHAKNAIRTVLTYILRKVFSSGFEIGLSEIAIITTRDTPHKYEGSIIEPLTLKPADHFLAG
jgi:hypothetical protein